MFAGTHIGFSDPENAYAKYPFLPGYTAVGEAIEVGPAVAGIARGDLLYAYGKHERIGTASTTKSVVLKPPASLDPAHIPFVRLAQVSYTALVASEGAPAGIVAVIGLGMIGNFAAQIYQRAGARVIGFDTLEARCAWARACGIREVSRVEGDLVEAVLAATGGERAALTVEATGNGALVESCLRTVGFRGTVVLLGSPRQKATIDVYKFIHRPAARLVGAHVNLVPTVSETGLDQRAVTRELLDAMAAGEIIVAPLLSRIVDPLELEATYVALEERREEVVGVLLDWQGR
jgi:threonine dehydrogenase-like Zn-dependent dehydrogenase